MPNKSKINWIDVFNHVQNRLILEKIFLEEWIQIQKTQNTYVFFTFYSRKAPKLTAWKSVFAFSLQSPAPTSSKLNFSLFIYSTTPLNKIGKMTFLWLCECLSRKQLWWCLAPESRPVLSDIPSKRIDFLAGTLSYQSVSFKWTIQVPPISTFRNVPYLTPWDFSGCCKK